MHRRVPAFLLRLTAVRSFFVRALKLGLILTPTEQKAVLLLIGLFVIGCLFKSLVASR